jgi:antitoxin MazE
MQVSKWGNSLAIRIPATVVEALALKEGDDIEVVVADNRSFALKRDDSKNEALKVIRSFQGRLPKGFKFDREQANER